jgi:hypothetical protein
VPLAVRRLSGRLGDDSDLWEDLDYVTLFHRRLGISVREMRYPRPQDQPTEVEQRFWRPGEPLA